MHYARKVLISKGGFLLAFDCIEAIGWDRDSIDKIIDVLKDDVILTIHMASGKEHLVSVIDQKTNQLVNAYEHADNKELANNILRAWSKFKEGKS